MKYARDHVTFSYEQLDGRRVATVIRPAQISGFQRRHSTGHDLCAHIGICIRRPTHSAGDRVRKAYATKPSVLLAGVGARIDGVGNGIGPGLSIGHGIATNIFLRHVGVPDMVEVSG